LKRSDLITKQTDNTAQPVNKTRQMPGKSSKAQNLEDPDQFSEHMHEIVEHLSTLQSYLDHQDAFAMDEVADWFSRTSSGKHSEYHHSPLGEQLPASGTKND